jgi:hypothetical protein
MPETAAAEILPGSSSSGAKWRRCRISRERDLLAGKALRREVDHVDWAYSYHHSRDLLAWRLQGRFGGYGYGFGHGGVGIIGIIIIVLIVLLLMGRI